MSPGFRVFVVLVAVIAPLWSAGVGETVTVAAVPGTREIPTPTATRDGRVTSVPYCPVPAEQTRWAASQTGAPSATMGTTDPTRAPSATPTDEASPTPPDPTPTPYPAYTPYPTLTAWIVTPTPPVRPPVYLPRAILRLATRKR